MNQVVLIGRLSKDVDLRYTPNGTAVANFTLAVNRKFANQNGEREADFINCQAWQKTAEFVANHFKKGQQMALEGRIQVRSYDGNDGQRRWVTEVVVEQVEFVGAKNNGSNDNANGGNSSNHTGSSSGYSDPQLGLGEEIVFDDDDLPF